MLYITRIPGVAFISKDLNLPTVQLLSQTTTSGVAATCLLPKRMPQLWEHAVTVSSGAPENSGDSISKGNASTLGHCLPLGKGNHFGEHHSPRDCCQSVGAEKRFIPRHNHQLHGGVTPGKFRLLNWWMSATMTNGGVTLHFHIWKVSSNWAELN